MQKKTIKYLGKCLRYTHAHIERQPETRERIERKPKYKANPDGTPALRLVDIGGGRFLKRPVVAGYETTTAPTTYTQAYYIFDLSDRRRLTLTGDADAPRRESLPVAVKPFAGHDGLAKVQAGTGTEHPADAGLAVWADGSTEPCIVTWGETPMDEERNRETEEGAAVVRREGLVFSLHAMPGPIGDALRKLSPDEVQIVNLRRKTNARGNRNSYADVAKEFRSEKKPGKTYTSERCAQIGKRIKEKYPILVPYVDGKRSLTDASIIDAHDNTRRRDNDSGDEERQHGYVREP